MKRLALFLLIALFFTPCFAEEVNVEEIVTDLSGRIDEINELLESIEIPVTLRQWFGNETINVFVDMEDNTTEIIGVKTIDGTVDGIVYNGFESPTLHVFVSEETLREIYLVENPVEAAVQALQEGKITYQGVGLFNFIKFSFIGILQAILGLLSSFFGG